MFSSSSHYPTKKLDVAITESDKEQGNETVPTSISPELDNLVVSVSDDSPTTSKLSDEDDIMNDEIELTSSLTSDQNTEVENVHVYISTLSDQDDTTAPDTNTIDVLSSSPLFHTKIIPTSAPNKIIPTSAPNKIIPTSAPNKIIPTSAPNKIIPTSAPNKIIPTSAPNKIIPTSRSTPNKIIPTSASNKIDITTQESSTQGSTTFSSYIPSTAGKTPTNAVLKH